MQHCAICKNEVPRADRYPRLVCKACEEKAVDQNGNPVKFGNTTMMGGGFQARHMQPDGSQIDDADHKCFIDSIPCFADEGYFGGIVVQTLP